jgi:hypothetical protein
MPISPDDLKSMQTALLSGRYSLLIGAGVSMDSFGSDGAPLPLGDSLRSQIISLKKLKSTSSLSRAYSTLTEREVESFITKPFSNCIPGPTCIALTTFLWSRIYSLNIDDSLEAAYEKSVSTRKQSHFPITHREGYRHQDPSAGLQIVHIHGWARRPNYGYVFSLAEYAGGLGPGNPWVNVLAQTIASEPFIIAGTNLEEPDLEYFLTGRSRESVRKDRGPSFLIEPYPDAGTLNECAKHGLILYEGTMHDFLRELDQAFPSRPVAGNVTSDLDESKFSSAVTKKELALFSLNFRHIIAKQPIDDTDLGFYVGREPYINDIALHRDISRSATLPLKSTIHTCFREKKWDYNFLLIDDIAGSGKTTILTRTMYDLAADGYLTFYFDRQSLLNIPLAKKILNSIAGPFIVYCDDFADFVTSIAELYRQIDRSDFLFVCTERSYRMVYVLQILGGIPYKQLTLQPLRQNEARDLIVKMDGVGLSSERFDEQRLDRLASELTTDSIAVAVCRIMNDFKPIERIVESLIGHADEFRLERYVACALAGHCYKQGMPAKIFYSAFSGNGVEDQFNYRDILPLAYTDRTARDFIVSGNPVLGQRILYGARGSNLDLVFDVYCRLGAALAPYINRSTIQKRTAETRIAGRLFDYDEVVLPILGSFAEKFYIRMKKYWDWNSRYWEQLALLKLDLFVKRQFEGGEEYLIQAITHARHAVKLDRHPLPMTTLGKVLIEQMKSKPHLLEKSFNEAYDVLLKAIREEGLMSRVAIHPYIMLLRGALYYCQNGGKLDLTRRDMLRKLVDNARVLFSNDAQISINISNLNPFIRSQ